MSTPRDLGDRVAEKEAQLKKALEKAELYKAQLKQLQAKKDTQDRKRRTHNLIIAGAELAALYGRVLYPEEVRQVIAFLRQQKDAGFFYQHQKCQADGKTQETKRLAVGFAVKTRKHTSCEHHAHGHLSDQRIVH